ncbi:MAG TPA: M1 family metallopeptidase [Blastocatellia bacterium]|nr:M1 family metallopeptidase [Blastocatellia bacterium]
MNSPFRLRIARLLLTLLCCVLPALALDDYQRIPALDAIHYRLKLTIAEAGDEIQAEAEILFEFKSDSVKEVPLDFTGLTVDQVTVENREAKFTRANDKLNVALAGNYKAGDRCRVTVRYHGHPTDGLAIQKNKFGDRSIFADNWPNRAHYWFPGIDHPYDKATVEFLVTAPNRYDVIANGRLVETRSLQNGAKLTHWSEAVPIPTYCMVIGATEFDIVNVGRVKTPGDDIPLSFYLFPKDRDKGVKGYGRASQIVEFFTNLIGPYPYEKLALVQSSTRFGGMENASSIFLAENAFGEGIVSHEIAHQWFGDSVTESDWHHLWLSEGFATYFGDLFFERADGRDKFMKLMLEEKEGYLKAYGKDPRPIYDPGITDLFKLLNANNYQKGGWVLHMLRHVMGDEKFFAGVRDYYRTYRDRNALTDDFRHVMEAQAGQPLDWFFREWIFEPGYPIYDAAWKWDEGRQELRLRITQKQEKTVFRMPLDVEMKTGSTSRREVVQMNEREQNFTFKPGARPSGVALDPDEWVLKVLTIGEEK